MNTTARLSRIYATEHKRWAAAWQAHEARVWGRLSTEAIDTIAANLDPPDDDLDEWQALYDWGEANPHASSFYGPPDLTLWPHLLPAPPPLNPDAVAYALALPSVAATRSPWHSFTSTSPPPTP